MVDENGLRDWVKHKLNQGVDPSRVKKSLKETGHDPSIVDEVQNPFSTEKIDDTDFTGDDVPDMESGGDAPRAGDVEDDREDGSDELSSEIGSAGLGAEESRDVDGFEPQEPEEDNSGDSSSFLTLTSISLPELPVWPAAVAVVLLAGVAGYIYVPWASLGLPAGDVSAPDVDLPSSGQSGASGEQGGSCPDVGVRINSVSSARGSTKAEVLVTKQKSEVVLEVYDSGNLVGSTTATVEGISTITVDATGDKAVFRPKGCTEFQDSAIIG